LSTESETKKLLEIREAMEARLAELEQEIIDLRRAVATVDRLIVSEGFRTPAAPKAGDAPAGGQEARPGDEEVPGDGETSSVTSKDGTVLGKLTVEGGGLTFRPQPEHGFTVDIPPFQSFLVDRVLANMSSADRERAAKGEITEDKALSFEVKADGGRLTEITVRNYGGERRLREISSSLRWSFDKMYDKLRQG